MDRRSVLIGGGVWGIAAALAGIAGNFADAAADPGPEAPGAPAVPSIAGHVRSLAERLSRQEFVRQRIDLAPPFNRLSYDQYRDIRFRPDQAIWRPERLSYELQLFPIGFFYDIPVDIWLVEDGQPRLLKADSRMFSVGPLVGASLDSTPFAFSGFRIHGPLNRSDYYDEFVVFQGASYFRAVGRNQVYGLSARGLAIGTAQPGGEEFPIFRAFWIEKPKAGAASIAVHALLDSQSVAGAYRFIIAPGAATVMDVDVTLFPRRPLPHVGIAPLTSMFLHGTASRRVNGDFRPAVHDSEGLAAVTGSGEHLWRPLTNPKMLQSSAFVDRDPKGFGLIQRERAFSRFEDLEAHYERRPSVWVEPRGAWGPGFVELIEIPAEEEIHDNIVAFWRPQNGLPAGGPHTFGYRLHWTGPIPVTWAGAWAKTTFTAPMRKADTYRFIVDFEGPAVRDTPDIPAVRLTVSTGRIENLVVQKNPEIPGVRVAFEFAAAGTDLAEFRLLLKAGDHSISETWLYRWTRS